MTTNWANRQTTEPFLRLNTFARDDNCVMEANHLSSKKILTAIVLLTVLLAAVAAILNTSKQGFEYSKTTPEGVVQRYLAAVVDGRSDKAAEYFSTNSTCDATDIDRSWISETLRVNLIDAEINGDSAYIEVSIDISSGGPFDDYYTENHNFRLAKESGEWKILGIPWPLYSCEEPTK